MRQIYLQTVKKLGILRNRLILYYQLHPSIKWKANDDPAKKMGAICCCFIFQKSAFVIIFVACCFLLPQMYEKKHCIFFKLLMLLFLFYILMHMVDLHAKAILLNPYILFNIYDITRRYVLSFFMMHYNFFFENCSHLYKYPIKVVNSHSSQIRNF